MTIQRHQAQVARPVQQIATTVIEHEQETPRKLGKSRRRAQALIQLGADRSQVEPTS
ncbi:hypothetical protein [Aeromicrobium sp. UC242_57]|uniref:hypothetical protein n=1 Tax=Aeromicrobium sp. UC242_57 TaxID=3374624 RepID=UPI00379F48AE